MVIIYEYVVLNYRATYGTEFNIYFIIIADVR